MGVWQCPNIKQLTKQYPIKRKDNSILNSPKVTSLFSQHKMEDGTLVKLVEQTASIHVRQVLKKSSDLAHR